MNTLPPREALDLAAPELGWTTAGQKLDAALRYAGAVGGRPWSPARGPAVPFGAWLDAALRAARAKRGADPRGTGEFLLRGGPAARDEDTGEPLFWNRLTGWVPRADAERFDLHSLRALFAAPLAPGEAPDPRAAGARAVPADDGDDDGDDDADDDDGAADADPDARGRGHATPDGGAQGGTLPLPPVGAPHVLLLHADALEDGGTSGDVLCATLGPGGEWDEGTVRELAEDAVEQAMDAADVAVGLAGLRAATTRVGHRVDPKTFWTELPGDVLPLDAATARRLSARVRARALEILAGRDGCAGRDGGGAGAWEAAADALGFEAFPASPGGGGGDGPAPREVWALREGVAEEAPPGAPRGGFATAREAVLAALAAAP